MDISVASLNIGGLFNRLPPLAARAATFGGWFERHDIDVVNLQEVWTRRQLAIVATGLPSYRLVAWRPGVAGQPAGGLATFSRLAVQPGSAVAFTPFRGVRARVGNPWFRARMAVNGRLRGLLTVPLVTRTGEPVLIAQTHLTANRDGDWSAGNRHHRFQRDQLAELHRILDRILDGFATPLAVLTGDFNVSASGPLYPDAVTGDGWLDPFAGRELATFRIELLPPGRTAHRIDYLLYRGDQGRYLVREAAALFVDRLPVAGVPAFVSDHCGLLARIGVC
jgi:exonuclease III